MVISSNKLPHADNNDKFQAGRVLILAACHFIHDVYSSFLAPLLPLIIEKLSISLAQAGLLSAVMQIPALANPLIGKLADRISVRYFIILAPLTTAVPMSLIGLAPSYGVLLILLFFAGISVAVFHVPAPVMVSRLSGKKIGMGMSYYMTGGELARTIGPMAAVGAVSVFGFEGFYPVMIIGFLASLWLHFKFKEMPIHINSSKKSSVMRTWRETRSIMGPLAGILIARSFMHASMTTFLPTFIKEETGNIWIAGLALTVFEAAGVAGILAAGPLSDRFGRRRILLISLVSAPLILIIFTVSGGFLRILSLVFTGIALLSTTPVMLALVQENSKNSPSAANGIFMMISFTARSFVVIAVGIVADFAGLGFTYLLSAIIGMLGIPFIFMLPGKK